MDVHNEVGAPPGPKSPMSTLSASLASAASYKPPPTEANASSHPSVVSPPGSIASLKSSGTVPATAAPPSRPRATISEAVKRTPGSIQSLLPAAVQPPPSPTMRPMGSISSIREVRDDGMALEYLQKKACHCFRTL